MLIFIFIVSAVLLFWNSKKAQKAETENNQYLGIELIKNKNLVNEAIEKISKLKIPVFTKDNPGVIIEEISHAVNLYSPLQFAPAKKYWQWWISDDGWNILDENAVVASLNIPVISVQDQRTGEYQPAGPKHPLSQTLNKFIFDTFENNGFQLNATNTSKTEDDDSLFDYVISFQKGELRCALNTSNGGAQTDKPNQKESGYYFLYFISCSNQFNKAYQEQVPYLKVLGNYDTVVVPEKRIGSFVYLSVHGRLSGYFIIGEMAREKMKIIFAGQEYPPCNLMIDNGVPMEIYEKCDESNYPYKSPSSYQTIWNPQSP
ncbi:MAG: hypothetical protein NTZ42_04060 [Candidatus Gribaldobacteria bacterium]|nr:hypothetical protein [Candidatus Gribaldobacteria bacterium]